LSCECGLVFAEDVKALQAPRWVEVRRYKRNRFVKKVGVLVGSAAVVLFFAAYFGGVFPMRGQSNVEGDASKDVADARPIVTQPVAPDPVPPDGNVPYKVFPESNVQYKATRAITGSVIAVTDADGQERRVTLFGIRVPKLDENFGVESKANLWTLIADKPLLIKRRKFTKEVDTIAEVIIDGSNVGLEQLRSGLALVTAEELAGLLADEQRQYFAAAQAARNGKYGMWSGKTPAAAQMAQSMDQTTRSNEPLTAEIRRPVQRRKTAGTAFDFPDYVDEPAPSVVPLVTEPVKQKEQAPAAKAPPKETVPSEPAKTAASPSAKGRKYERGPFGGCFYINSNGNKTYVDRSKCDAP